MIYNSHCIVDGNPYTSGKGGEPVIYLVDPKGLSARKPPCKTKCDPFTWCAVKPLYGVWPGIPS